MPKLTAKEELDHLTAYTDDEFFSVLGPSLPDDALVEPRHFVLSKLKEPYNLMMLLSYAPELDGLFPLYNMRASLVIRGRISTWPVKRVFAARPEFPAKITNIDFVGYGREEPDAHGDRPQFEIVRQCENLAIITVDIAIDDCLVEKHFPDGSFTRRSATLADIQDKYQFSKLCPTSHTQLKELRYRLAGLDLTWKKQFARTVHDELKAEMAKRGIRVVQLEYEGWFDPYLSKGLPKRMGVPNAPDHVKTLKRGRESEDAAVNNKKRRSPQKSRKEGGQSAKEV